jgi:Undecaprenyl-phosphate glucose phosphotransferase
MFRTRAYLTNICLGGFDFVLTAVWLLCFRWYEFAGTSSANAGSWFSRDQILALLFAASIWVGSSAYFGLYHSRRLDSPFADLTTLLKASVVAWVLLEAATRMDPSVSPGPSAVVRFSIANFILLAAARSILRLGLRELRRRGFDVKQIVLVTSPEIGHRLVRKIEQRSHYGYQVIKHFLHSGNDAVCEAQLVEEFAELMRSSRIDDVILALPAGANALLARLVALCESQGINVRIVPDLFPLIQTDTQIYDLDGIPLVNIRTYPAEYFGYAVCKRIFDFTFSLAILILLSPLLVTIGLLVKMTSKGPLLFSQERVGLNGRKFKMLKFRTMEPSVSLDPDSHWTVPGDPNVTPLGRRLRRYSLDELPQFLNVLKGDMSIVGPRPERPFFLERFRQEIPDYMARHYVKSGITGWAQVNGWRGDTAIEERVAHDLYYIRNWGMKLDLKILVLTLMRTIFQTNAY